MTLCPCVQRPPAALPRRKRHTWSSIGPHRFGNSAQVVAAATTAVGAGSTVFSVTSPRTAPTLATHTTLLAVVRPRDGIESPELGLLHEGYRPVCRSGTARGVAKGDE